MMASAKNVFETAISVTSLRSRLASAQALAISCSTAASPQAESSIIARSLQNCE
ncbi:MAG: hypothetical protein MZV49_04205 [Rhodopseudomonas palustris]|nr:hypothetical protein [Rhodopseudomonas palustris]